MTTSAYNLGKSGLASKVLRIMDLVVAASSSMVGFFPVLGTGVVLGWFADTWLVERLGIVPNWLI